MSVQLETLEFEIQSSAEQASKGIDALSESLGRLRIASRNLSALSATSKRLKELSDSISGLEVDKLSKLGSALESISRAGRISISASIPKRISEIGEALKHLDDDGIERLNRLADGLRNLEGLRGPTARLSRAVNNSNTPRRNIINQSRGGIQQTLDDTTAKMDENRFTEFGKQMEKTTLVIAKHLLPFKEISTLFKEIGIQSQWAAIGVRAFLGVWSLLIGILKKVINFLGKVLNLIKKVGASIGKMLLSPFVSIGKTIKGMGEKVKQLFESLKRIALYRLIRSAIKALSQAIQEGIHNLYQYSRLVGTDFAKSMDKIATASLYVKNSLAAMVSPLINQVSPIIDSIGDKLAEIANKVNIFISRLLGKNTYTAAKKLKTTFEEIKSAVIGIDELNIIGDGEKDYAQMFEELPITGESSFVDKLRELFENADWKELGKFLGSKVNELIDMIDWKEIGKNIGNLFDAIFQTIYGFLSEVDTEKLGQGVADLISEFLGAIDWKTVGRLLVRQITILWDFLIGFFEALDWGEVAKTLFDFLSGALDEIHDWLKKYDWLDLGKTLLKNLQDFFDHFDFEGLLQHFFKVMGEAVRAIKDLLTPLWDAFKKWWAEHIKGKDFLDTVKNLVDYLMDFFDKNIITPFMQGFLGDEEMDGSGLAKLKEIGEDIIGGILKGISDFITNKLNNWFMDRLLGPFVNGLRFVFGIHSPAETMIPIGENIALGILEGIIQGFGTLLNTLNELLQNILTGLGQFIDKVLTAVGDGFVNIVTAASDGIANVITAVSDGFVNIVTATSDGIVKVTTAFSEGFATVVTAASDGMANVLTAVSDGFVNVVTAASDGMSNVMGAVSSGFTTVVTAASDGMAKILQAVSEGFTSVVTAASEGMVKIINAVSDGFTNVVKSTTDSMTNIITSVGDGFTTIVNSASNGMGSIITAVTEGFATIVESVSGAIGNIVTAVSITMLNGVLQGFDKTLKGVNTDINEMIKQINELKKVLGELPKEINIELKIMGQQEAVNQVKALNEALSSIPTSITVTINVRTVGDIPSFSYGGYGHATGGIIPHARGGIIGKPTLTQYRGQTHLFGEAGREAILPLDSNTEWMDKIAEKVEDRINPEEEAKGLFTIADTIGKLDAVFDQMTDYLLTGIETEVMAFSDGMNSLVSQVDVLESDLTSLIITTSTELNTTITNIGTDLNLSIMSLGTEVNSNIISLGSEVNSNITSLGTDLTSEIVNSTTDLNASIMNVEANINNVGNTIVSQMKTTETKLSSDIIHVGDNIVRSMGNLAGSFASGSSGSSGGYSGGSSGGYSRTSSAVSSEVKSIATEVSKSISSSLPTEKESNEVIDLLKQNFDKGSKTDNYLSRFLDSAAEVITSGSGASFMSSNMGGGAILGGRFENGILTEILDMSADTSKVISDGYTFAFEDGIWKIGEKIASAITDTKETVVDTKEALKSVHDVIDESWFGLSTASDSQFDKFFTEAAEALKNNPNIGLFSLGLKSSPNAVESDQYVAEFTNGIMTALHKYNHEGKDLFGNLIDNALYMTDEGWKQYTGKDSDLAINNKRSIEKTIGYGSWIRDGLKEIKTSDDDYVQSLLPGSNYTESYLKMIKEAVEKGWTTSYQLHNEYGLANTIRIVDGIITSITDGWNYPGESREQLLSSPLDISNWRDVDLGLNLDEYKNVLTQKLSEIIGSGITDSSVIDEIMQQFIDEYWKKHGTGAIIKHAVGGIFDKTTALNIGNAAHVFGEAGREAVLPLDSYTGWMDDIAAKVDDRIKGNEDGPMSFEQALNNFYMACLEPVMSHMDENMQRQADKDEHPVVKIGNRDIRDAYNSQTKADGYKFTR